MRKLILILLMLALFALPSLGQSLNFGCGESLSEADCEIWMNAQSKSLEMKSANFNLDMLTGFQAKENTELFNLNLNGSYNGDFSVLANMGPEAYLQMLSDPTQSMAFTQQMMTTLGLHMDINLHLGDKIYTLIQAEAADNMPPQDLNMAMKLVNGVLYFNLDQLRPYFGESEQAQIPAGWFGFDLMPMFNIMATMMDEIPSTNMTPDQMDLMSQTYNDYYLIQRLESDDENIALFELNFNYADYLQSDAYREVLKIQMQSMGDDNALSDEMLDKMIELQSEMLGSIILKAQYEINLQSSYMETLRMEMRWTITEDMEGAAEEFSEALQIELPETGELEFYFEVEAHLSEINTAPPVMAPEEATLIPLFEALMDDGL